MFVLECRVPTAPSRPGHQFVDAEHVGGDHVVLDVCRYDPVTQILDENHVRLSADGLVRQFDRGGRPIHAVWGIPRGETSPAVLITAYRPDPARWADDFLRRTS